MAFNDEIMVASGEAYDPEHPSTEKATLEKTQSGGVYKIDDPTESTISDDDYFPFYDSSASAKKKSLWSTIVDKLKSIFNPPIADIVNVYGAKNLIPFPYHRPNGYTTNGATFTYDNEGIITVNKVAGNATAYFALFSNILFPNAEKFLAPNTSYILSMVLEDASNTSCFIQIRSGVDIAAIRNKATGKYEVLFTTSETIDFLAVGLYYGAATTETNAKVKLMIRLASIEDSTYVPYAKTNKQLTNDLNKAYTTDDSASTTINDTDYVPLSDANGNRKKTLWSNIVDKIKTALGISSGDTYLKKDGTWGTPTDSTKVAKSGDTMSGALTFSTTQGIKYTGTKATYPMIKFIDNTGNTYGNGILIGGGGLTIIGGGESADTFASGKSGGEDSLYLTNDGNVTVVTNLQNGTADGKTFTFGSDGTFNSPSTIKQNNVPVATSYDHPTNARYGTTGSTTKIKIKINSTASWMLCFTVILYQGYRATKVMISGYNYGANHWYEPEAVIIADSNNSQLIPVYFGYDATNQLWVGFDGGSYTGVAITDVCNGYTQISNYNNLFTISNVSSLTTEQTLINAYFYAYECRNAQNANYATSAGTANNSSQLGGYSASTSATGNTIAMRQANGYLYATYYNSSNGAENPASYTSYAAFVDSNGWHRKCSKDHFQTWLGLGSAAYTAKSDYATQSAFTSLAQDVASLGTSVVYKSGSTMTGNLAIQGGNNRLTLGKSGSAGSLWLYHDSYHMGFTCATLGANRTATFPNSSGTVAWTSSSRRIKENIRNMADEEAQKILDIDVIKFDYKGDWCGGEKNRSGFIAEDVMDILPETVQTRKDYDPNLPVDEEYNFPPEMDYQRFVPYIVKMVQIQQDEINELKAEIRALKED